MGNQDGGAQSRRAREGSDPSGRMAGRVVDRCVLSASLPDRTDGPGWEVMRMEWPSTVAECDAVIVRDETTAGLRFVVYSRRGPQLTYRTYAEAEARALAHAEHARAHAWYRDGSGFQLLSKTSVPISSSATRGPK